MRAVTLVALALIPLQWFTVAPSPIGELRVHQLAMFALTGVIIAKYGLAKIGQATRRLQYFIGANVYMLVLTTGMDVFNHVIPIQPIQSLLYVVAFTAISAYFFMIASGREPQVLDALRWSGLVTVSVLILAFTVSLAKNGINPVSVIQTTIATADPSFLTQQLFGKAFIGFGFDLETTQTQIRHEVFGGMLLSMYVASWAKARRPFTNPRHTTWFRIAMVVGAVFVLLSLSRAVTLAAAAWPALLLARALLKGRISGGQIVAVIVTFVGVAGLAATGFLSVVWDRFTQDTSGYASRTENISDAITRIFKNFWTGGFQTESQSSHNFILDNWQRDGVLVAIPAILVFLYIMGVWISLLLRLKTLPPEMLPVSAALALPVFRMMTQGGGQISVNAWITLAFVAGVIHSYNQRKSGETADDVAKIEEPVNQSRSAVDAAEPPRRRGAAGSRASVIARARPPG